jgi:hypothetical protein
MTYPSPTARLSDPYRYSSRGDFIDELNGAIRDNPVPAALIGAGLLWMFMGGASKTLLGGASRSLFSGLAHGAQQTGAAAYRGARGVGSMVAEGASAIAETAGAAGSQAAGAMRNAADALSGAVSQTTSQATQMAKTGYDVAGNVIGAADDSMSRHGSELSRQGAESYKGFQQALAGMLEKQPLLLGAVGIAVGAAIAASVPASNVENRLMGDTADSLKDKAQELWSETSTRADLMASKGLEEAKAQGLTPESAGQALRDVTEKAIGVAEAATRSVSERIKGQEPGFSAGPPSHSP